MTEQRIADLASAIVGLRASLRARAPRLAALAARLRELEVGLDYEAAELDVHAAEMISGLDAIAHHADGLLEETAVELLLDDVADEDGSRR